VVSLFIFPTGPTALDSEPRGRRYVKNTGHDWNRLYSRAIHCLPVWRCITFIDSYLRACRILRFVKKLDFAFMGLGGPSHGARVWCLGRVPKHRNQWQEVEGLLFMHLHTIDSEPHGRRYVKNMIYNRNRLYSRAIHCPASMEMHYVQWILLKSV
jgi:hypothetical protein